MVCLGGLTLKKSEHFEEFYKTPKQVSKLSNKQIKDYLGKYGWVNENDETFDFPIPEIIASPIDRIRKGLEFRSGETGDIEYSGIINGMVYRVFSDSEAHSYIGRGAYFNNRKINIDTYFNKVLYEAYKRKIIKICNNTENFMLGDLMNIGLNYAMKRDSIINRESNRWIKELYDWQRASEEHMRNDKRPIGCAVA